MHPTLVPLLVYTVLASIPGLLGLVPGEGTFAAYQAATLLFFMVSMLYFFRREGKLAPRSVESVRFFLLYVSISTVSLISSVAVATGSISIFSIAQIAIPVAVATSVAIGLTGVRINKNQLFSYLRYLLLFLSLCSIYNIAVNLTDILNILSITSTYDVDFRAFFYNRNVFGFMMATGIIILTLMKASISTRLFIAHGALLLTSLLLSMSRGAILFVSIYLILFLFFTAKNKLRHAIVAAALCLLALPIMLGSQFVRDNIIRIENGDTGRSHLHDTGLSQYRNSNALFGGGHESIEGLKAMTEYESHHNLYIETLVTQGLLGIALLILIFTFSLAISIRIAKYDKTLSVFFISILISFLIYICFESLPLFYATPNSILATTLLVILPLGILNKYAGEYNSKIGVSNV